VTARVSWLAVAASLIVPPSPAAQASPRSPALAVAVLAGGCYWGVESVFRHVRGIRSVTSGFAVAAPRGLNAAGHVEAVRITYDPSGISYRQILDIFFLVAHDPTQRDRQGPDVGPEYRSVVFVASDREGTQVRAVIDSLERAEVYPGRVVTEIAALGSFQPVGDDQQNYAARHPTDPYIVAYDVPRVEALRRQFPRLYWR
jgi:peptide-methionine (S)-S-oxide reductase